MRVGHRNERAIYNMGIHRLEEVEKELGVLIHRTLSVSNNCAVAVKKGSLTSHIGKLLERIIRDHIMRHLDNKQLINPSQHGFLPGRSCQSTLLEFLERATDETDRGNNTGIAYLDFAKAFDATGKTDGQAESTWSHRPSIIVD